MVMAADRPCGKFYDIYSVSLENFGSTLIVLLMEILTFRCQDLNPPVQCHRAEIFRAGF